MAKHDPSRHAARTDARPNMHPETPFTTSSAVGAISRISRNVGPIQIVRFVYSFGKRRCLAPCRRAARRRHLDREVQRRPSRLQMPVGEAVRSRCQSPRRWRAAPPAESSWPPLARKTRCARRPHCAQSQPCFHNLTRWPTPKAFLNYSPQDTLYTPPATSWVSQLLCAFNCPLWQPTSFVRSRRLEKVSWLWSALGMDLGILCNAHFVQSRPVHAIPEPVHGRGGAPDCAANASHVVTTLHETSHCNTVHYASHAAIASRFYQSWTESGQIAPLRTTSARSWAAKSGRIGPVFLRLDQLWGRNRSNTTES